MTRTVHILHISRASVPFYVHVLCTLTSHHRSKKTIRYVQNLPWLRFSTMDVQSDPLTFSRASRHVSDRVEVSIELLASVCVVLETTT